MLLAAAAAQAAPAIDVHPSAATYLPDGRLAIGWTDGTASILDKTGVLRRLTTFPDRMTELAATADGRHLLGLTGDNRLEILDLTSGRLIEWKQEGRPAYLSQLVLSPDGTRGLVNDSRSDQAILIDIDSTATLAKMPQRPSTRAQFVGDKAITADAGKVYGWTRDGKPLWQVDAGKMVFGIYSMADSERLIVTASEGGSRRIDAGTGANTPLPTDLVSYQSVVGSDWVPIDDHRIVTYDDTQWRMFDLRSLAPIGALQRSPVERVEHLYHATGPELLLIGADNRIALVNDAGDKPRAERVILSAQVLAISADRRHVVTDAGTGALLIYSTDEPASPPNCFALQEQERTCAFTAAITAFLLDPLNAALPDARTAVREFQARGLNHLANVRKALPRDDPVDGTDLYLAAADRLLEAGATAEALRAYQLLVPTSGTAGPLARLGVGRSLVALHRPDDALTALLPLQGSTDVAATTWYSCPSCDIQAAIAQARLDRNESAEALAASRVAVDKAEAEIGPYPRADQRVRSATYLLIEAQALDRLGQVKSAATARERAATALAGAQDVAALRILTHLGVGQAEIDLMQGQADQAVASAKEAVALAARQLPATDSLVIDTRATLGTVHLKLHQPAAALEPLRAAATAIETSNRDDDRNALAHDRQVFRLIVAADWEASHPIAAQTVGIAARSAGGGASPTPAGPVADVSRHGERIDSIAFSLDGKRLISSDVSGQMFVWDVETSASLVKVHTQGNEAPGRVGFATNGDLLADPNRGPHRWHSDGTVISDVSPPSFTTPFDSTWTAQDITFDRGKLCLSGKSPPICWTAPGQFAMLAKIGNRSADGKRLFVYDSAEHLVELRLADLSVVRTMPVPGGFFYKSLAVTSDERILAAGNDKGDIMLLDRGSGKTLRTVSGPPGIVKLLVFSSDGSRLASVSDDVDKQISVWNIRDGTVLARLGAPKGPAHTKVIAQALFSPDGEKVVTAGADQTVRVWNAASGAQLLEAHIGATAGLAFTASNRLLAADYGGVNLVDVATGTFTSLPHLADIDSADVNSNGAVVRLSGVTSQTLDPAGKVRASITDRAEQVRLSPNGTLVATMGSEGISVYNATTGARLSRPITASLTGILPPWLLSDDRLYVATTDDTGNVVFQFDARSGRRLPDMKFSIDCLITALAISRELLYVSGGSACVLARDGVPAPRTLYDGSGVVEVSALSPDGSTLAAGFLLGGIKLIDVTSGKTLLDLSGHASAVTALAFSSDGTKLVSAGKDAVARVWDAKTGALRAVLGR